MFMKTENPVIYQCFQWYTPADGTLWNQLAAQARDLKAAGIDAVWMPPAYKGSSGKEDVGYGVYDMYDLGEFNQKGSVRTKYGTKTQYLRAIRALHDAGLEVIADLVFNHRMGGDETETVLARPCNPQNRMECIGEPREIEAWTRFTFPGRKGRYSTFTFDASCFDGCDYDNRTRQNGIYLFDGKNWDYEVDGENANYDYLMGCDLDMSNARVLQEMHDWGLWYLRKTGVDAVRFDALKHITLAVLDAWLRHMRSETGRPLPAIGEYWTGDLQQLLHAADFDSAQHNIRLFDVPLHFHFQNASNSNGNFDLGSLYQNTLTGVQPDHSVTFVNNHDTQPHQALESYVLPWFQPAAYSLILLRREGLPCVFAGDWQGIPSDQISGCSEISILLKARKKLAYGETLDYFDNADLVGFVRTGDGRHPHSGLACILSDHDGGTRHFACSQALAQAEMVDILGRNTTAVKLDENGEGDFPCAPGSVSVYVRREAVSFFK